MIAIISLILISTISCSRIFPPPKLQTFKGSYLLISQPCPQIYMKQSQIQGWDYYYDKVISRVSKKQCFGNKKLTQQGVAIVVKKKEDIRKQGYEIVVTAQEIIIQTSSYEGYVYAMESLSQLLKRNRIQLGQVKDEPLVSYRGIMIDSVRHFISIPSIRRLIESMPLAKLNSLHWHLSDDQTFTLSLITHPQLAEYGTYTKNQKYSIQQVKDLLTLAKKNAVNIIPEFDTPAHVRAWGLAPTWKNKNITILCPKGQGYNHQFDLSKSQTFTLTEQVLKEIDNLFVQSPYLHLGGDQVFGACWDLRPSIKSFMKLKNIEGYGQLQMYWRYKLKQSLPKSRKTIFWRNNAENVTTGPDDVLHFWGAQADVAKIVNNTESKIILSPSDLLYFNTGKGNLWLNSTFGTYYVWKQIYEKFILFPEGVAKQRILGAQACLWGQVSNEDTLENNLWTRATALGARLWSQERLQTHELVQKLVQNQKQLIHLGVDPSPITSQFCENSPEICFAPKQTQSE